MASAIVDPDLDEPQSTPPAAGQPASSLAPRAPTSHEPPNNQVAYFDHLTAYLTLREAKDATRKLYSNKNSEYLDALEGQNEARERLEASRQKPKRYRRVKPALNHWDAPEIGAEMSAWLEESLDAERGEMESEIGDAEIYEEEEGLQGTFWGWDDSNEAAEDRGAVPGEGGPLDPENHDRALVDENREKGLGGLYHGGPTYQQPWVDRDEDEPEEREARWEWETISDVSAPDSLFDEDIMNAKEEHQTAKKSAAAIWEEMRAIRTEECRLAKQIKALQDQYPELRGYVGEHRSNKRKPDETFDGKYEAQPPPKRARTGIPHSQKQRVTDWHATCISVLKSHSTLTEFPTPIHWDCQYHEVCFASQPHPLHDSARTLRACEHNIRDACDKLTKRQIKVYMTMFHPDRFSACQQVEGEKRQEWKAMANEIFVVLSSLWDEREGDLFQTSFAQKQSCTCASGDRDGRKGSGCTCGFKEAGSAMGT